MLTEQKKAAQRREAQQLAETQQIAKLLESKPVAVRAKAGGNGRLFGTVTNADIADAITQTFSVSVDKHKIEVKNAIKALGSYPVEIRLGKNIVAKTTVSVVAA
jgi:large subunit ribosomal protein L9